MLVEPGDILSAIFLTHAEEKETFILVLFGLSLFLSVSPGQCLIPYLLRSLFSLSFVRHLALLFFFFFSPLVRCDVKLCRVQTGINAVSERCGLLIHSS